MHTVVVVIAVIVLVPLGWVLSPRGPLNRRVNEHAKRREEEGHGNFMTKPLWGDRDRWRREGAEKRAREDGED